MLDPETGYVDDAVERVPPMSAQESSNQGNLDVRRRIEHIREVRRLRELLDDPDFNELG